MDAEREWRRAIERTSVLRAPSQRLATFGVTNLSYYVVTEPVYQELGLGAHQPEGVVRTGRVIAERPAVVTPTYALNLQGFSDEAYDYFREMASQHGPNSPGILYRYRNEPGKMDIVSGDASEVGHRINGDLEQRQESMSVVLVGGVDALWDVALLRFIVEYTNSSVQGNVKEFQSRGLLDPEPRAGGVPRAAAQRIEQLFREAERGKNPQELKDELDRWGMFDHYQDRFLGLFRRRG